MKNSLLTLACLLCMMLLGLNSQAQHPRITINQLQYVSPAKLAACNDSSSYFGDTVTIVGVVVADANLIDVPSSSVQGGFRPFVHVVDTANNGASGDFNGLQVMGVYTDASGASLPVNDVYNLYAGMVVEITGVVGRYQGETQLNVLNNSSLKVLGSQAAPSPVVVDLGKLNDNTRTNKIATGEEFEDSYVELRNLTVSAIYNFSGSRVSFDVTDENGNVINVSDRFFVQKTPSYTTTRSTAPVKQGAFKTPVVGTKYNYIRGIVMHSENGCSGGTGRGYEINPFDTSHYRIGATPPNISLVTRTPLVPKDVDAVKISAKIVDFDGSITGATFHYSASMADAFNQFTAVNMTLKSGTTDTYEAEIPKQSENTVVRYYISATDNANQMSYLPFAANSTTNPDFLFYTVRNGGLTIADVQKVLYVNRDASPFVNQVVTVTGVVTASAKPYDLEAVYIQDPNEAMWAAIKCQGNSELIKLFRGEEVKVTGTVAESFGFTVLNVTKVERTGAMKSVKVSPLDPSDSAFYFGRGAEAYEGMLVGLVNPAGGKVYVSNPQYNAFGEYLVSTNADASYGKSRRIQAGIQNTNNSSSLWVSIVSDTALASRDGIMNVKPIAAVKGMSFDTLVGILYYGFSNYNVLPRNDDDFRGSSVTLPATKYPEKTSVSDLLKFNGISLYPNPVLDLVNIGVSGSGAIPAKAVIYSLSGAEVATADLHQPVIDMTTYPQGVYLVHLWDRSGKSLGIARLIKH